MQHLLLALVGPVVLVVPLVLELYANRFTQIFT